MPSQFAAAPKAPRRAGLNTARVTAPTFLLHPSSFAAHALEGDWTPDDPLIS